MRNNSEVTEKMKKTIVVLFVVAVMAVIGLVGCGETKYTVSFDVDGKIYTTAETDESGKVTLPAVPEKDGYVLTVGIPIKIRLRTSSRHRVKRKTTLPFMQNG